jgi:hypothetical protein
MNDHIGKPVEPERLYEALLRWLPSGEPAPDTAGALPRETPPSEPVDWAQVHTALGQLERLLAEGDFRAKDLWREIAPSIRVALGPVEARLAEEIARYDYDQALETLRATRC